METYNDVGTYIFRGRHLVVRLAEKINVSGRQRCVRESHGLQAGRLEAQDRSINVSEFHLGTANVV